MPFRTLRDLEASGLRVFLRADLNAPDYAGLRDAVVRLGRSVYIDEGPFLAWLSTRRAAPPVAPRNPHGRGGKTTR